MEWMRIRNKTLSYSLPHHHKAHPCMLLPDLCHFLFSNLANRIFVLCVNKIMVSEREMKKIGKKITSPRLKGIGDFSLKF